MTATDLKKDMMRSVNGASFINLIQLTRFLGYSDASSRNIKKRYLEGLPSIQKMYFIPEVVERVMKDVEEG